MAKIMMAFWTALDRATSAERIIFSRDPSVLDTQLDSRARLIQSLGGDGPM